MLLGLGFGVLDVVILLGVPMIILIMRLCTRRNVNSKSLVRVHAVQPYKIIGVTVVSKSCKRDFSG